MLTTRVSALCLSPFNFRMTSINLLAACCTAQCRSFSTVQVYSSSSSSSRDGRHFDVVDYNRRTSGVNVTSSSRWTSSQTRSGIERQAANNSSSTCYRTVMAIAKKSRKNLISSHCHLKQKRLQHSFYNDYTKCPVLGAAAADCSSTNHMTGKRANTPQPLCARRGIHTTWILVICKEIVDCELTIHLK